jgi:hypothetical protein
VGVVWIQGLQTLMMICHLILGDEYDSTNITTICTVHLMKLRHAYNPLYTQLGVQLPITFTKNKRHIERCCEDDVRWHKRQHRKQTTAAITAVMDATIAIKKVEPVMIMIIVFVVIIVTCL